MEETCPAFDAGELEKLRQQESSAFELCLRQIRCSIEELLAVQEQRHQRVLGNFRYSASVASNFLVVAKDRGHQLELAQLRGSAFPFETLPYSRVSADQDTTWDIFTREELDAAVQAEGSPGIHSVEAGPVGVDLYEQDVSPENWVEDDSEDVDDDYGDDYSDRGRNWKTTNTLKTLSTQNSSILRESRRWTLAQSLQSTLSSRFTNLSNFVRRAAVPGAVLLQSECARHTIEGKMLRALEGKFSLLETWNTTVTQMLGTGMVNKDLNLSAYEREGSFPNPRSATRCYNKTCQELVTVRPRSWQRCCWDLCSILVVLYDIAMLPTTVFEFDETQFDIIMFWITLTFWSLDIVFSFFTGYQLEGKTEMRLRQIAIRYVKGWFAIDMLAVMPDWIVLLFGGERDSGFVFRLGKAAKVLRILRALRLLRVFRLLRAWNGLHETVTNHYLLSVIQFAKFVLLMFFMSHFSACAFYGISKLESHGGWIRESGLHSEDRFYMYLTSLHWATSQLHGSMEVEAATHLERLYGIFYLYVSLISASVFVSSITNVFWKMQKLREETFLKTLKLLNYLEKNCISGDLTARIQSFARHATDVSAIMANEVELLKILPEDLLKELTGELKSLAAKAIYALNKILSKLPEVERATLIDALSQSTVSPGTHLFQKLESSGKMFILWRGKVMYHPNKVQSSQSSSKCASTTPSKMTRIESTETSNSSVSKTKSIMGFTTSMRVNARSSQPRNMAVEGCRCIAEMNLWTSWQHQGDCIISGYPTIFSISAKSFGDMLLLSTQNLNVHLRLEVSLFLSEYVEQYLTWMDDMMPWQLDDLNLCMLRK